MRQLQGMNIKSMLVLKIVSIVSKYQRWIKNYLAFLPSEFLIDNQIIGILHRSSKVVDTFLSKKMLIISVGRVRR